MDFVVSMMLDLDQPVTSVQNAASFGYFDCISHQWNTEILAQAGFPKTKEFPAMRLLLLSQLLPQRR